MKNSKENFLLLDNNINDIFERKVEVGAVIQFNLLQRLIEEFIKRQKKINDKVNNLEIKINNISQPTGQVITDEKYNNSYDEFNYDNDDNKNKEINIEKKSKEASKYIIQDNNKKDTDKDLEEEKEEENETEKKIEKEKIKEKIKEKEKERGKEVEREKKIKKEKEKEKGIEKGKEKMIEREKEKEVIENKENESIFDDFNDNQKESPKIESSKSSNSFERRLSKLEVIIKELTRKITYTSPETKVNIDQLKSDVYSMKKHDDKIKSIEKNIQKINETINEFNIFDIFNKQNVESDKKQDNSSLISALIKKMELIENRTKECEEELFKSHKKVNDINNTLSTFKNNYNDFVKDVNANFNEIKTKHNNDINNVKNLIDENIELLKNDVVNAINKNNVRIKDVLNNENTKISLNQSNNANSNFIAKKLNNEKLNNMSIDLKNYINKSTSDTEKYLKTIISNLGIDDIKKDMTNIREELKKKLVKPDLNYVDQKLKEFGTKINDALIKFDVVQKDVDICNDTCSKSVKMIEYLSGQVVQAYQPDLEQMQREEMAKKLNCVNDKELQNFTNKNEFNKEIKNLYKKIEETLEIESENYKFIQHIDNRLKFFVTQNELKIMEQCLMNDIDEFKNEFSKKYMEKTEIFKNLKILELQIKNIYDNLPGLVHPKEGDNWLLAKKPLNSYLCASCEAYIGDLNNKNIYLPWNKIPPPHNNKKYRMGNGFSRMLQLVNMDLMKNAEKVTNNLTIKIDDKKNNNDFIKQLPRIGSQISMRHLNHPNSTFSLVNNEASENKLNNSADGLENLEIINGNSRNNNNLQEYESQEKTSRNVGTLKIDKKNSPSSPKVMKIVKKIKKDK